jgi:hypothetical protein
MIILLTKVTAMAITMTMIIPTAMAITMTMIIPTATAITMIMITMLMLMPLNSGW